MQKFLPISKLARTIFLIFCMWLCDQNSWTFSKMHFLIVIFYVGQKSTKNTDFLVKFVSFLMTFGFESHQWTDFFTRRGECWNKHKSPCEDLDSSNWSWVNRPPKITPFRYVGYLDWDLKTQRDQILACWHWRPKTLRMIWGIVWKNFWWLPTVLWGDFWLPESGGKLIVGEGVVFQG